MQRIGPFFFTFMDWQTIIDFPSKRILSVFTPLTGKCKRDLFYSHVGIRIGLGFNRFQGLMKKIALNVVGPQVQKFRARKDWTQAVLAEKLQLLGWNVSLGSVGKLEAQLRRVPDCELLFLAKVLGVDAGDLLPKRVSYRHLGPQFQSGKRLAVFPTRGEW